MNYAPIDADGHVMETDDELRRYLPPPFEGGRALTALFPDGWPRSTRKAPDRTTRVGGSHQMAQHIAQEPEHEYHQRMSARASTPQTNLTADECCTRWLVKRGLTTPELADTQRVANLPTNPTRPRTR